MNLPEKLGGDVFDVNDVINAFQASQKHTLTGTDYESELPAELREVLERAQVLALKHDIPLYWAVALPAGNMMRSELGVKPQNVNPSFLLSRASLSGDEQYMQNLFMKLSIYMRK